MKKNYQKKKKIFKNLIQKLKILLKYLVLKKQV